MNRAGRFAVLALLVALPAALPAQAADSQPGGSKTPVGIPSRIEQLIVEGGELEAAPLEDRQQPIVVRIVDVRRHGSAFRYDLEFYGLEPGSFDLRDYLRRKDDSAAAALPSIPVEITSSLPPGQIEPHALQQRAAGWFHGYRLALISGGALWAGGLAWLLLHGRRKRAAAAVHQPPATLAERLRPLVEAARAGELDRQGQATLERLLLAFWRRRLNLEEADAAYAVAALRQDEQAGPLLRQVETWLHAPGSHDDVDIGQLLEPYQSLPADAASPTTDTPSPQGAAR